MLKSNTLFIKEMTFASLICLTICITSCGSGDGASSENQESESKGTELTLGNDYPVVADITACVTENDLDELGEFIIANDKEGFAQKVAEKTSNGTAFRLEKGTKVRLIDRGFGWVKVRVLEGAYQNQMGYFDTEFIKGFNN